MKSYSLQNMIELGINPLTEEACCYQQRILCDLDKEGVELLAEYLGIHPAAFPESYNCKVGKKPAIASIMLDKAAFVPIIVFASLQHGWRYIVVRKDREVVLVTNNKDYMTAWEESSTPHHIIINNKPSAPFTAAQHANCL